jgi:tetratricopeptide (TPR) repeat protein
MPESLSSGAWRGARIGDVIWSIGISLLVTTVPLPAQSVAQRAEIEAFRDSIGAISDSVPLITAEKLLIAHASHELRDSAMAHIRLGFISMRLGDLSGKQHYENAASEFQWATDLQPKWPYGWFGLGLAELGVGDAEFALLRGLQSALGKDALTRSANDFARSAEVDPGFVRGLVELSNTALRQRVNLRMGVALAALRRAARTPAARNPEVQLVRARIEREVGSPDSALVAVDSLVAHHPGDAAALLEQARVRFKLGRVDGAAPWYQGLGRADPSSLALYRADLRFVLPDSTLHAFDAASGAARTDMMQRFWNVRDRDELHTPGERLVEHYRRLDVARHNYRLASVRRHYDIIERYRPPVQEFDDRGVVYIRQGEPDGRASLEQPGVPNNESWAYHRSGEPDLLFHFVAREGVGDYRLVESILDIVGYANAVRLQNSGNIQGTDAPLTPRAGRLVVVSADSAAKLRQRQNDLALSQTTAAILRSRTELNPIYQRMLTSGKGGSGGLWTEERSIGSRSIRVGTTTDSWERRYAVDLPADVLVLTAVRDSVRPMVEVAYAIPTDGAPVATPTRGAGVVPRVRVSILGLDGSVVSVLDTVGPAVAAVPIATRNYLVGVVAMPVSPGRVAVRVGLELGRAGVVSGRDTVTVPAPAGPALGLSDLVLGAASVPLWWISDRGDTIRVNPVGEFRAAEPIELSFELEGLVPDSSYRIEMVVRKRGGSSPFRWVAKLFGGGRDPFTAATTQRALDSRILVQRGIALRDAKPGEYVFEVTVSHRSDPKVTRTQEFTVVR